jgi:glutathione S-transferase
VSAELGELRAENERLRAEAQDCCTCEQPTHSVDTFCWACKLSDLEEDGDTLRAALAEARAEARDVFQELLAITAERDQKTAALAEAHRTLADRALAEVERRIRAHVKELRGERDAATPTGLSWINCATWDANVVAAYRAELAASRSGAESAGEQRG